MMSHAAENAVTPEPLALANPKPSKAERRAALALAHGWALLSTLENTMSNWIIRCANPRCRHVCDERDWVYKPKQKPTEADIQLRTKQAHCPKCDCISYYKAKPKEIAKAGLVAAGA